VKLHEVPTTDQAADTLLREYVQRTLGFSTNSDAPSDTQAAQGKFGGVQGTFGGVQGTFSGVQGTNHNKNTSLVLISRDHGFAPMLTQARQAGVLTVLLLPVAYKSQTIDISGRVLLACSNSNNYKLLTLARIFCPGGGSEFEA
jgi:hypothetical protein